jgi:hypothetical protein
MGGENKCVRKFGKKPGKGVNCKIISKCILMEKSEGVEWIHLAQDEIAGGSRKHADGLSSATKGGEFVDCLSDHWLLHKDLPALS